MNIYQFQQLLDEILLELAKMLGFDPELARGHFTSGGTMANFDYNLDD